MSETKKNTEEDILTIIFNYLVRLGGVFLVTFIGLENIGRAWNAIQEYGGVLSQYSEFILIPSAMFIIVLIIKIAGFDNRFKWIDII